MKKRKLSTEEHELNKSFLKFKRKQQKQIDNKNKVELEKYINNGRTTN
jgi:hypothetical protein